MATININAKCDLNKPVVVRHLDGMVFSQDVKANMIRVSVFRDREPVDLSGGSVSANIIRADGATVVQTGTIEGNVCSVVLPSSAYAVPGQIAIFVKHSTSAGPTTSTIAAITGYVYKSTTDTIVDPGSVVPNVNQLLAMIEDCEEATEACIAATEAAPVVDDTAGAGDTNKVWSANKSHELLIEINSKTGELKSAINEHDEFLEPLGYTKTLYGNDKFVSGMYANGSWRSDGNYGKYRSVHELIPVNDCLVVAETETYTNLVISIDLFDTNKTRLSSLKINGVSVMNSTDIQSGSFKIKMSDITATSASAVYMSVGIGKVSGSTYYDLPSDLELSIVQPSSAENIADRVATLESKMIGDEVYSNNDFVNGMYANGSWRSDGNYGKYRSVHELITLDDYAVIAETETYTNMVISVDLFDSSNNRLGGLVLNDTGIQNGKYVISKSTVLAKQANTAKISIGIGKFSGSTYYDLPSDLKLSVIKAAVPTVIIVDCNGGGDYKTIAEAVNNAPDSSANKVTVYIKPGVYDEHIHVGGDRYLSFVGENRETCIIRSHTGMYTDAPLWIDGNFTIENLTLQMLDDEAPNTWTPGTSQSDPATMLPGYALHIDGGSSAAIDSVYGYKLGVVRNCTLYSVAFPAIGAGLHANQKLIFEDCDFIRITSAKYNSSQYQYGANYTGAMIIHDTTQSTTVNQNLDIIRCRFICNLSKSATFRFKYGNTSDVRYAMIDNTFWCEETDSSIVDAELNDSVLLGYSHGNNNSMFNQ